MAGQMIVKKLPACLSFQGPRSQQPLSHITDRTDHAPAFAGTGLDITNLNSAVQKYFEQGLALSLQPMYKSAHNCFHKFCVKFTVCNPFPLWENLLCNFVRNRAIARNG